MKLNCWEVKQCGCQPRGEKSKELGVCPASIEHRLHGVNGGINGGRACWAINQTLCGDQVQENFPQKFAQCMNCDFYSSVIEEEGENFLIIKEIIAKLKISDR